MINKDKYDLFFEHRENLIFQYKKGDLTKDEFIEENYNYIISMDAKPFKKIDYMNKAIFNYQYYNALAKYYQKKAHYLPNHNLKQKQIFFDNTNYYYKKKDNTTIQTLKLIDYKNVRAYCVKVKSSNLKNKLFEIVFDDYENLIFHSTSPFIKERLIEEGVFQNTKKTSVIDSYINQKF
ncbi:MAG: DUF6648 family protein [Eubacteriales bacterium]